MLTMHMMRRNFRRQLCDPALQHSQCHSNHATFPAYRLSASIFNIAISSPFAPTSPSPLIPLLPLLLPCQCCSAHRRQTTSLHAMFIAGRCTSLPDRATPSSLCLRPTVRRWRFGVAAAGRACNLSRSATKDLLGPLRTFDLKPPLVVHLFFSPTCATFHPIVANVNPASRLASFCVLALQMAVRR